MLAEIQAAAAIAHAVTVPDDLITYADIRATLDCGHSKAQALMNGLVAAGSYERIDWPWKGGRLACFRKCE